MGMGDGRPDWRRIAHDFLKISRKSRANRCELSVPSSCPLIANKDTIIGVFYSRVADRLRCGKNEAFLFAIMGRKEVAQIGGGLSNIFA